MSDFRDLGSLIKLISDNLLKIINREMSRYGLTFQQFQIMEYIMSQKQDVSQKEIENYLSVAHPTVVGLLKRMEMKNFIVCKFSPRDKRIKYVYLTNRAFELMKEVSKTKEQFENEAFRGLNEGQKNLLLSSLNTVFKNINIK